MFVTRSAFDALMRRYDHLETRYENLLDRYHTLRVQGASVRPTEAETPKPTAPASDIDLVYNTQRQLAIDSAYEDFIARGMAPDQAKQEAQRTIDSIFAPIAGEFQ